MTAPLIDERPSEKLILSSLWAATMFVFAYVDIFAFWRRDVIEGALDYTVPTVGFTINQSFLLFTTLYILPASLMVAGSLLLPARINRPTQIVLAALYALTIVAGAVGDPWHYYKLGSAVEVLLLAGISWTAWKWRRA